MEGGVESDYRVTTCFNPRVFSSGRHRFDTRKANKA